MTVLSSLFSGISGIVANGSALSVEGDNIANINTIGFKSSSALFESNLTQKIGDVEIGLGSRLAATQTAFSQGAFTATTRATDLAIEGSGFFAVQNSSSERFYTRAGAFSLNDAGEMVTTIGGFNLLGFAVDENGTLASTASVIDLSAESISSDPEASTTIGISANLDPSETEPQDSGGSPLAFDGSSFTAADASSNFNIPATMYDSLGEPRDVITYFRKSSTDNVWDYYVLTEMSNIESDAGAGMTVDGSAASDATVILKTGRVSFTTGGVVSTNLEGASGASALLWNLSSSGTSTTLEAGELVNWSGQSTLDITWNGAAALAWDDFSIDLQTTGNLTQQFTGSGSTAKNVTSDGRGLGELQAINITEDGSIVGQFTNGTSRALYSIPLALFANEEGLSRVGSNLFEATTDSGDAVLGSAAASGRGEIRSSTLEQSNVDIARAFVNIIQYQRAFQASSRTVTAASDLLAELVQLGR